MDKLNSLITSFISEAKAAPKLFQDLSKVEEYISETYLNRSFIELIQNADDAEATKFGIHKIDHGFVVCNNGRPFTTNDIEALCRSGASNKKRGGDTIGFRGIGFKSVVKLAESIALWSGDYKLIFDKEKTKSLLQLSNAPVIRVPHVFIDEDIFGDSIKELIQLHGYTTIFYFINPDYEVLNNEINGFDSSCLLFLNHIIGLNFEVGNLIKVIDLTRKSISTSSSYVKIYENTRLISSWYLHNSLKNIVAFKSFDNEIIAADGSEAVIHSFTPTIEFTGAFIKINGDFSTDPSRKSINLDNESRNALNKCVDILCEIFVDVISEKITYKGFFRPFINTTTETHTQTSRIFITETNQKLLNKSINIEGRNVKFENFRLCPAWLNYDDYQSICSNDLNFISKHFISLYPESIHFFDKIGIKYLNLKEIEERINVSVISTNGACEVLIKLINQYSYDMNTSNIEKIKQLKIFPLKNVQGLYTLKQISSTSDLNEEFFSTLSASFDSKELSSFFKKLNIEYHENLVKFSMSENKIENTVNQAKIHTSIFNGIPKIDKWRSAEQNLVTLLKSCVGVDDVFDVSSANIGYDIEVNFSNGKKAFIEVKSVSFFGESFKITNNEYSTAHNFNDKYYIALVMNNDDFQVSFIQNPINNLSLNKQCERWSWFCNNAINQIIDIDEFITFNV
ncbi:MAG: DUF3883 domain-containing protein [Candidatus Pacebacteria bacterium]|nr:DUF3883 domain-containing protein [Candidatus Paceibacterota bacterium]MDD4453143.1 DUF3883 domain-containing protein [Proteiniphilum sp.]